MKVSEFNRKFGTEAGEDLIGTIKRDQLYGFGGNDRLYAQDLAKTSSMAAPETTCWTVEWTPKGPNNRMQWKCACDGLARAGPGTATTQLHPIRTKPSI
jgi:hypothetical protein